MKCKLSRDSEVPGPKQVYLPSEYSLYRQLVEQMSIKSHQRINFKKQLKKKYEDYISTIEQHAENKEKFEISRQNQLISRANKLKEIQQYITNKQKSAQEKKQAALEQIIKKAELEQRKKQEVINRNHRQYVENIEKSMVMIKQWKDKIDESVEKKKQALSKISNKMHDHNDYVMQIKSRMQSQISAASFDSEGSEKNPEISLRKKSPIDLPRYKKSISRKNKYFTSNRSHSKEFLPEEDDFSESKLRKNKSELSQLKLKKEMDASDIERSLCRNVEKEKKITEARHLKKYIHLQRNKITQEREADLQSRIQLNREKMQKAQKARNQELDLKFYSELKKPPGRDVSLPLIHSNKVVRKEIDDGSGNSFVYLTSLNENIEDNSTKYNKAIMDKMRGFSLVISRARMKKFKIF